MPPLVTDLKQYVDNIQKALIEAGTTIGFVQKTQGMVDAQGNAVKAPYVLKDVMNMPELSGDVAAYNAMFARLQAEQQQALVDVKPQLTAQFEQLQQQDPDLWPKLKDLYQFNLANALLGGSADASGRTVMKTLADHVTQLELASGEKLSLAEKEAITQQFNDQAAVFWVGKIPEPPPELKTETEIGLWKKNQKIAYMQGLKDKGQTIELGSSPLLQTLVNQSLSQYQSLTDFMMGEFEAPEQQDSDNAVGSACNQTLERTLLEAKRPPNALISDHVFSLAKIWTTLQEIGLYIDAFERKKQQLFGEQQGPAEKCAVMWLDEAPDPGNVANFPIVAGCDFAFVRVQNDTTDKLYYIHPQEGKCSEVKDQFDNKAVLREAFDNHYADAIHFSCELAPKEFSALTEAMEGYVPPTSKEDPTVGFVKAATTLTKQGILPFERLYVTPLQLMPPKFDIGAKDVRHYLQTLPEEVQFLLGTQSDGLSLAVLGIERQGNTVSIKCGQQGTRLDSDTMAEQANFITPDNQADCTLHLALNDAATEVVQARVDFDANNLSVFNTYLRAGFERYRDETDHGFFLQVEQAINSRQPNALIAKLASQLSQANGQQTSVMDNLAKLPAYRLVNLLGQNATPSAQHTQVMAALIAKIFESPESVQAFLRDSGEDPTSAKVRLDYLRECCQGNEDLQELLKMRIASYCDLAFYEARQPSSAGVNPLLNLDALHYLLTSDFLNPSVSQILSVKTIEWLASNPQAISSLDAGEVRQIAEIIPLCGGNEKTLTAVTKLCEKHEAVKQVLLNSDDLAKLIENLPPQEQATWLTRWMTLPTAKPTNPQPEVVPAERPKIQRSARVNQYLEENAEVAGSVAKDHQHQQGKGMDVDREKIVPTGIKVK